MYSFSIAKREKPLKAKDVAEPAPSAEDTKNPFMVAFISKSVRWHEELLGNTGSIITSVENNKVAAELLAPSNVETKYKKRIKEMWRRVLMDTLRFIEAMKAWLNNAIESNLDYLRDLEAHIDEEIKDLPENAPQELKQELKDLKTNVSILREETEGQQVALNEIAQNQNSSQNQSRQTVSRLTQLRRAVARTTQNVGTIISGFYNNARNFYNSRFSSSAFAAGATTAAGTGPAAHNFNQSQANSHQNPGQNQSHNRAGYNARSGWENSRYGDQAAHDYEAQSKFERYFKSNRGNKNAQTEDDKPHSDLN